MPKQEIKRARKEIPERLIAIRGKRSQREFARALACPQQNINRYEKGTAPHPDFLLRVALRENISLDWLLLGRGRMQARKR